MSNNTAMFTLRKKDNQSVLNDTDNIIYGKVEELMYHIRVNNSSNHDYFVSDIYQALIKYRANLEQS